MKLIETVSKAIQIPSYSDEENRMAEFLKLVMEELSFDEVLIDSTGNVIGFIGQGDYLIQFDGHLDTVKIDHEQDWKYPPFSGEIADGAVWGRGSVDMKSGLIAAVFAAHEAKTKGYLTNKRVMVTGTVCEEYCDGVNLVHLYNDLQVKPDVVIICEPSSNEIALGHKGKAQVRLTTHGLSAHGSAPEKGVNAVYLMAEVIQRVEALNEWLRAASQGGSVVLSDISSVSASLNAVPSSCTIYLDRRLGLSENLNQVKREMDQLIAGIDASWEVGTLRHTSWTGKELVYEPMHEPWEIGLEEPLTKALIQAVETVTQAPAKTMHWDFGTNAITPVGMGIPTIGLGPGEYKLAHMVNEHCSVDQIEEAKDIYLQLIKNLSRR